MMGPTTNVANFLSTFLGTQPASPQYTEAGSNMSRPLYGGYCQCDIPAQYVDVSNVREVPDNQEVLLEPNSNKCVIVEIVEYQDQISNEAIAKYHFDDIAEANKSGEFKVSQLGANGISVPQLGAGLSATENAAINASAIAGQQHVANFNEPDAKPINIYVGTIRIPHKTTEILFTINDPDVQGTGPTQTGLQELHHYMQTFTIRDWSLFG
eukprot:GFYU01002377.1.p1 GENE.GFYU01002377.1~~GFYU01002377.1.p1  ORF type:complete len:233 (-),score=47.81 GFYU01002377.1:178-810(-)